jgi:hypothetical protein
VGYVGRRAPPHGDGLLSGGRRQRGYGCRGHFYAGVEGRQRAVAEVRVRGEELLIQVRVALLDA